MEISGASVSSSLLTMLESHVEAWPESRPVDRATVPIARLDALAGDLNVAGHRCLLKLDVQGYELAVLRGAAATLAFVRAVFTELLFTEFYENQASYLEVMGALDRAGFRFVGMFDSYMDTRTSLPLFANGLFVRANG